MNPVIAELAVANKVTPDALKKWRQRGKVPPKYWYPLLSAAENAGKPLTVADFKWTVRKRPAPKAKRRAA